jgi:hypothetical protein
MTCHKSIGLTLTGLGEAGHTAELSQLIKFCLPAGEHLMDIGLVTHIEDQSVLVGIINRFQGNRKLHHAQIGGKVAAGLGYPVYQKFSDLVAQQLPLIFIQPDKLAMS